MTERVLSSSPIMPILFARAGAAMIPGASRLPLVAGGGGEIPDLTFVLEDVAADSDRVARYRDVCGFSAAGGGAALPATYPHMLAFPLHLALMTDARFPFGAIGLVHILNRIVHHRPIAADERLSLRVRATPLEPHPRGKQFSTLTEVRVGDELVWEEVSTNLRRGRSDDGAGRAAAALDAIDVPDASDLPEAETWELAGDVGRRYGAVSGDLNPIHIHPLTARLFGFPSAIAHGMWTKARCVAVLAPELPDAFTVDVAFRKPILLPATVAFASGDADTGALRFGVRGTDDRTTPHLDGQLTPA